MGKYDNDERPWGEIVKQCSFCRKTPTFVQMGQGKVGIICRPCWQSTRGCMDRDHAIYAWNRKKR